MRDRRCFITGEEALGAPYDSWESFEAAHIFPLAYEGYWVEHDYSRWITIQPATGGYINSVQNGLLLESGVHQLFNSYLISINPNVGVPIFFYRAAVTYTCFRTITRLSASRQMGRVSPAGMLISNY